jgi:phage terminase large subunit
VKGSGSVNVGITKVKSCVNYMTEGSDNGWNEYSEYKWALDADKNPTDTPVDKYNHLMDGRRYFELNKGRLY